VPATIAPTFRSVASGAALEVAELLGAGAEETVEVLKDVWTMVDPDWVIVKVGGLPGGTSYNGLDGAGDIVAVGALHY
jgi:hypothetical protein